MTKVGGIDKGEGKPNAAPGYYHGIIQTLSIYLQVITTVVVILSAHTRRVDRNQGKMRTRMYLYVNIEPQRIIYLLWAIFLDSQEFFSIKVQSGDPLPDSQLRYTTNFPGLGHISTDIIGVPVAQLLECGKP